ncbi:bifunctional proline dehydrogenase/L-glutamate gamma-semialdehyde dehydrogenase PutA [Candidatus Spongiihabitans sp.]|uniref:bifunctional proline dehydrogenase/L-glutamate gamma-semialdehyde dehydrogenase PutA n=1 Tax=Candidatus Spongiihabitans sp. TaxID=3101308 RepID=UPI003C6F82DD
MKFTAPFSDSDPKRRAIRERYHADETECAEQLLDSLEVSKNQQKSIEQEAIKLVQKIRQQNENHGGLDAFLQEFKLSSEEGVALMCLAEALLRVPDAETADQLIQDKLSERNWAAHLGGSESFFVNASTWGLMLTGKVISLDKAVIEDAGDYLGKLIARSGEPVIRAAVKQAMKIMGKQFVLAETIQRGLKTAESRERQGYRYSYDMLGEAARTDNDAQQYLRAYLTAINAIAHKNICKNARKNINSDPCSSAGISVKLSALHPRYEYAQATRIINELFPRLKQLCIQAKSFNIGLTIDAEESERLDPSLSLLQMLCNDPDLDDWNGLGFVVQAYQKRAPAVIDWIEELAVKTRRKMMIRLVKGAYWDSEIKKAQVAGYKGYPVYTRKITTDVAYLVCARKLINNPEAFYPLFATHNALTVTSILNFVGSRRDFEFQCLHGMGEILYRHVIKQYGVNCRIYAPIGPHKDLLAYLVRRLLENGANSSFVNRLVDRHLPIATIVADPIATLSALDSKPHPNIPLPKNIYGARPNSMGLNLNNALELELFFLSAMENHAQQLHAAPLIGCSKKKNISNTEEQVAAISPATGMAIGMIANATKQTVNIAVENARKCAEDWDKIGGKSRAKLLMATADCYENNRDPLSSLCIMEAGKTLQDAIAEIREAVDFLRYYAQQCESEFERPQTLTGPTGELNQWSLHGRGVFVCISPWNFPLAIFTGQISAALAAGNSVIAKPAEQTPIIAYRAVQLMHDCGIPEDVLQLLPGDGANVGSALVNHPQIDGVAFTGSTETAKSIQRSLANKPGAIVPLIAETGGINAMIVDSTALPEQVIADVIQSAFQSAGQRCSALRVLYLQEDIAEQMIEMLIGAMAELKVGDPAEISTDIGPIIDQQARKSLMNHITTHEKQGNRVIRGAPVQGNAGYYLSPALIEIEGIGQLQNEVFGPILHVCRFAASEIDRVVDDINNAGYGLTFGIHSRIKSTVKRIVSRIKVGNVYVNRNTIGAVVGVQPFGGEGLSGTGPKAGGPHYLHRFAVERSVSTDTTATGGNTTLLSLA